MEDKYFDNLDKAGVNDFQASREMPLGEECYFNPDYNNMSAGERLVQASEDLDNFVANVNFDLTMDGFKYASTDLPLKNDATDSRKRLLEAANALYSMDFDTSEVLGEETSTKRSK